MSIIKIKSSVVVTEKADEIYLVSFTGNEAFYTLRGHFKNIWLLLSEDGIDESDFYKKVEDLKLSNDSVKDKVSDFIKKLEEQDLIELV